MKHRLKHACLLFAALVLAAPLALLPQAAQAAELPDFVQLMKEVGPAVVNINTTQKMPNRGGLPPGMLPDLPEDHPLNELFRHFFEGIPQGNLPNARPVQSLGSGFIIDPEGIILTNAHVVKDADIINVRLPDRREFPARLLGLDERTDVAVLKIEASHLPTVRLGDSDKLQVGEWVLAIGSPFGLDFTATQGIVSALGRNLPDESYVPFIQTDAAINPGNSGGPLFNARGEVVGINSQIYSRSGGYMGLSFAIPINTAMQVAEQLRKTGKVTRGWLGVMIQPVDADLAKSFGLDRPRGALIAQVQPDSPADKAGLRPGDVILSFDGQTIDDTASLPARVGATEIGKRVELEILRDGKSMELPVTIEALPEEELTQGSGPLGLSVQPLDASRREELGVEHGLLVRAVSEGPAARAGVRPGDVLLELAGMRLASVEDLRKAAARLDKGRPAPLRLMRDGSPLFLALRLE